MASGDTLVHLTPRDFFPESFGPTGGEFGMVTVGLAGGVSFPSGADTGAVAVVRLPKTASLSTGATVKLLLAVDPLNSDVSKAVVMGVNFGIVGLTTAYYAVDTTVLGTEATGTMTIASAAGKTKEMSIAIVVANMSANAAADQWFEFRVRRLGTNASDTCKGRVVLLGATILDT